MSLNSLSSQEKQKYLLGALVVIVLIGGIVIWYGYFRQETVLVSGSDSAVPQEITINFSIFEDPIFDELGSPVTEIPTPDLEKRVNPFIAN